MNDHTTIEHARAVQRDVDTLWAIVKAAPPDTEMAQGAHADYVLRLVAAVTAAGTHHSPIEVRRGTKSRHFHTFNNLIAAACSKLTSAILRRSVIGVQQAMNGVRFNARRASEAFARLQELVGPPPVAAPEPTWTLQLGKALSAQQHEVHVAGQPKPKKVGGNFFRVLQAWARQEAATVVKRETVKEGMNRLGLTVPEPDRRTKRGGTYICPLELKGRIATL